MDRKEISDFEAVQAKMQSAYKEFTALSTKNAEGQVNKFKLNHINRILADAGTVLGGTTPLDGFREFDIDSTPSNSDVTFVLSQFLHGLEKLRADNIVADYTGKLWFWKIDGAESDERTAPPTKLKF